MFLPQPRRPRPSSAAGHRRHHSTSSTSTRTNPIKRNTKRRPQSAKRTPSFPFRTHLRRQRENKALFNFVPVPIPLVRLPPVKSRETRDKDYNDSHHTAKKRKKHSPMVLKGTSIPFEWWESAAKRGDKTALAVIDAMGKDACRQEKIQREKLFQQKQKQMGTTMHEKERFSVEFRSSRSCFGMYK